jgi:hypothetical protein
MPLRSVGLEAHGGGEGGLLEIFEPLQGKTYPACGDLGSVRMPLRFQFSPHSPIQRATILVLLNGDELDSRVESEGEFHRRLLQGVPVHREIDAHIPNGCHTISVLLDVPTQSTFISASSNFCISNDVSEQRACPATQNGRAQTRLGGEWGEQVRTQEDESVWIGKVEERIADAKAPSDSSNSREGGEHDAREVRGRGTAEETWDEEPRLSLPPPGANVCVGNLLVQVLGLAWLQQHEHSGWMEWGAGGFGVVLRVNGVHVISEEVGELALTSTVSGLLHTNAGWDLPQEDGEYTLQLDVVQNPREEGTPAPDSSAGPVPLFTHTLSFRITNDLTCLDRADLIRAAGFADAPVRRAARRRLRAGIQRQQDTFLASLLRFPDPPRPAHAHSKGLVCTFTGFCFRHDPYWPFSLVEGADDKADLLGPKGVPFNTEAYEYASIASALLRYRAAQGLTLMSERDRDFVVVELGAGFGRWGLETVHMGKRLHVHVRPVLVEADPMHVSFIRDAIRDSETPVSQVRIDAPIPRLEALGR